jgi:ATP-dependent Clp protease ATP-binding subunit ClpC
MYEKLSKRVETVIKLARQMAREGDQEYLGTEHVLLAIAQEGTGAGSAILMSQGADEQKLAGEVEQLVRKSLEETWVFGTLPGSPHLKSVVANAVDLAQQIGSSEVCTEHLLLAMSREEGSVAAQALANLGVTEKVIRAGISQGL